MDNRHDNSRSRVFTAVAVCGASAREVARALLDTGARAVCACSVDGVVRACVVYRRYREASELLDTLAGFKPRRCSVKCPTNVFKDWLEVVALNRDPCTYTVRDGKLEVSEEVFPRDLEGLGCYCRFVEAAHFYAPVLHRLDIPLPRFEDLYCADETDDGDGSGGD